MSDRKNKAPIVLYIVLMGILVALTTVAVIKAIDIQSAGENQLPQKDREIATRVLALQGLNASRTRARVPYVMFRPTPHPTIPTINSLGFNSPEITKQKADDEYRIAILGGSTVFTGGPEPRLYKAVAPDKSGSQRWLSIVAFLAEILKDRLPGLAEKKVTFINAGIPSAVSGQELAQLLHHVIPLNIDLLVVYDGFNDFYIPFNYDRRAGYPYDYIVEEYRFLKGIAGIGGKDAIGNIDKMYQELGIEVPGPGERMEESGTEQLKKEILEKYFFNIMEMAQVARGFRIPAGFFLQPYSERNTNPFLGKTYHHLIKLYNSARNIFDQLSRNNDRETVFQDLTYMNDRLDGLFMDIVHSWWDPSHKWIAEEIFKNLDASGMFEHLKENPNGHPSSRQANFSRSHDQIRAILESSMEGLQGELTDKEIAPFKNMPPPGIGDMAMDRINKYYDGNADNITAKNDLINKERMKKIIDKNIKLFEQPPDISAPGTH